MTTECTTQTIVLQTENHRTLVARFDGGTISSDAGMILLKKDRQPDPAGLAASPDYRAR